MANQKTKAAFFLSEINNIHFLLIVLLLLFSNVAFSFSPSLKFLHVFHYDTTGCNKDTLDWSDVPEGVKDSVQKYTKGELSTTISSKNKKGVSSSFHVGKKFKNESSLEWSAVGGKKGVTSDAAFNFNLSPDNFNFNLNDIDKESDDIIDSLVISAYRNGELINLSDENIISIGTAVSFTGNNSFTGIQDADDTSDEGDISISYSVAIDSLIVSVNNASITAKVNSKQQVGVGNFSWCAAGRVTTPENEIPSLSVSEILSPNGDDILDAWIIEGIERYPKNFVKIFNVWGDLVFEQQHYDNEINPWRGECNQGTTDQRIPDGTYYYILNPGDGSKVLKGFVMVKR
jgi:gliding motility-associated-like protein